MNSNKCRITCSFGFALKIRQISPPSCVRGRNDRPKVVIVGDEDYALYTSVTARFQILWFEESQNHKTQSCGSDDHA